jgi:hypothetical protein
VAAAVKNGEHMQLHRLSSSPSHYHYTHFPAGDPLKHHDYHPQMLLSSKALPAGEKDQYSQMKENMSRVMTRGIHHL